MRTRILLLAAALIAAFRLAADPVSEISVRLLLDHAEYVEGERVRAVIDVANASPDVLLVGREGAPDRLFVELFRAEDMQSVDATATSPFTVPFLLKSSEGRKFEVFLADHFPVRASVRYLARAVLVHAGTRYEGALHSFDVVPGMRIGGALQMFANRPGLKREFELVYWGRDKLEHLFLKAKDVGDEARRWGTTDLGPILRVTAPKISIRDGGEVTVLHRATQDAFVRSEFWSLPDAFEFEENSQLVDPDIAGAQRVKELYREAGGVQPVKKAWWKFW